jgi:phage gp37-like protein
MDMSFKDSFDRYKNGNATEEERRFVEEEIDKNILITEYLEEKSAFKDYMETEIVDAPETEFIDVKRSLRRRNGKLVALSVCVVLCFTLLYHFVFIPLGSLLFYNPSSYVTIHDDSMGETVQINTLADAAISFYELHHPSLRVGGAYTQRTGLGTYEAELYGQSYFGGSSTINRAIRYGKVNEDLVSWSVLRNASIPYEIFSEDENRHRKYDEEWQAVTDKLKELPQGVNVEISLTFDRELTAEEMSELINRYPLIHISWAGVETGVNDTWLCSGFDPFYVMESDEKIDAKRLKEHFLALIQTQIDHSDFTKMLNQRYIQPSYYKEVKNYVESNGLKVYGLVLSGSAKEILGMLDQENVIWAQIEGAAFDL